MKKINWHSVKTVVALVILFIIGGLQALKGSVIGDTTSLVSFLLIVEHYLNGNSENV
jgi:hypothetical protein